MDEVKRKVLLDLFASPLTLLPVVVGVTALMASWAFGGNSVLTFGGVAGMLGGVGVFATRMIFGLEKLTNRAYEYVLQTQQAHQERALDALRKRLVEDQDPRTQQLLERMQGLYQDLKRDIDSGKITVVAHEVLDGVDNMFNVCVEYLERSLELWQTAGKMNGSGRKRVMAQREELIAEVAQSCDYLEQTIQQLSEVTTRRSKSDLAELRAELDESIRVARAVEQRSAAIGKEKQYNEFEFE